MLLQFIPQDTETTQLVAIGGNAGSSSQHSYESERDLLYKILYELRGNVRDLRREVDDLRKQLDEARGKGEMKQLESSSHRNIPAVIPQQAEIANRVERIERVEPAVQDAVAEEISEPETLNLENINRHLLEKALEKNGGNRKKAAQELGISDRTLYRKIKQYGLDK